MICELPSSILAIELREVLPLEWAVTRQQIIRLPPEAISLHESLSDAQVMLKRLRDQEARR